MKSLQVQGRVGVGTYVVVEGFVRDTVLEVP